MIGKLSGIIDSFGTDHVILDVGGVGYIAHASARTLGRIGAAGNKASLLIHTQVREDAITLYGFVDLAEQQWFKLLTTVQGVGAKAALAILSACGPEQLGIIIASQDRTALTRADGIGPKLATRILSELKDKTAKAEIFAPAQTAAQTGSGTAPKRVQDQTQNSSITQDAVSALTNLGYARAEAYGAVMRMQEQANDNLEELIRLSLKDLSA
ncbi:MAG: Holliday junction branch migration protein RuvA [Alphaproteobacteria bacterium]|nr:Holliday junction branch migration protein RuvA [Alphaproteobacteria bacterium]